MGCLPSTWTGRPSWRPPDGARLPPKGDGQEARAGAAAAAARLSLSQEGLSAYPRRCLAVEPRRQTKRLPELLTDRELVAFYEAVWQARHLTHMVMLKLLIFTGMRNAELVRLRLTDVDLRPANCDYAGKRAEGSRTCSFPPAFAANSRSIWNASRVQGATLSL